MKHSQHQPVSVPRTTSLFHELQQNPGTDEESRFGQLMIFLDKPPPGVGDRWKKGAKMCAKWGISCTGASVWRLYRRYVVDWRLFVAKEATEEIDESPKEMEERTTQLTASRVLEVLSDPETSPASLIDLARLELKRVALDITRKKLYYKHQSTRDLALIALFEVADRYPESRVHLNKFISTARTAEKAAGLGDENFSQAEWLHSLYSPHSAHSPDSPVGEKNSAENRADSDPKQHC
jgi:hypothetical protein